MTNAFPPSWRNASSQHELHWRTLPARQEHAANRGRWIRWAIVAAIAGLVLGAAVAWLRFA